MGTEPVIAAVSHVRRRAQATLSRHALLYLRLLRWTGRGCLEKRVYLALIRPGDVVLDVGAHHGDFTLLFSDLVRLHGEVHAFEPLPSNFARLREATRRHCRHDNVFLNRVACSEHAGPMTLYIPGDDTAQASLRPHHLGSWSSAARVAALPVQAVRLDDYGRGSVPERVDFVKCDVEGAELPVLRGMRDRLARCRPLLFLEANSGWTESFAYLPGELVAFLAALGYDRFYLVSDHVALMTDAQRMLSSAASGPVTVNVLCAQFSWHAGRLKALAGT
jgi:FkbM family methyltransferase